MLITMTNEPYMPRNLFSIRPVPSNSNVARCRFDRQVELVNERGPLGLRLPSHSSSMADIVFVLCHMHSLFSCILHVKPKILKIVISARLTFPFPVSVLHAYNLID